MKWAGTSCTEKCAASRDVDSQQRCASHVRADCCTSFSPHEAEDKHGAIKRTAPGGSFLSREEKNACFFHSFLPCNCLILVSERVSGLIRAFPSIGTFVLYLLLSLSHKTGGQTSLSGTHFHYTCKPSHPLLLFPHQVFLKLVNESRSLMGSEGEHEFVNI